MLAALGLFYFASGAFTGEIIPWYFSSYREVLGMVLLLILMPTYIIVSYLYGARRTLQLATLVDATNGTQLANVVTQVPLRYLALFGFLGWLYAIFVNVPSYGLNLFRTNSVEQSIILGQMVIWTMMGYLLFIRARIARSFNHASKDLSVDIFETTNLRPFAQIATGRCSRYRNRRGPINSPGTGP